MPALVFEEATCLPEDQPSESNESRTTKFRHWHYLCNWEEHLNFSPFLHKGTLAMTEIVIHDLVNDVSDELHMDKLEAEVVLEGILYDEVMDEYE